MPSNAPLPMIQDICFIRPMHSLNRSDAQAVRAILEHLGCYWSIEQHDDYDGDLMLLISIHDEASFLLRRTSFGVELIDVAREGYLSVGTFCAPEEAILHLHRLKS